MEGTGKDTGQKQKAPRKRRMPRNRLAWEDNRLVLVVCWEEGQPKEPFLQMLERGRKAVEAA